MRGALRIGKLFGVDIHIDGSWLLIAALMTWNLSVVFRGWHPSWAFGPALLLATIATLLFFVCILAHELAHALVARSFGMTVRQIRLFLFGGVSDIEQEPPSPGVEWWIAIAGPLMSLTLSVPLVLLAGRSFPETAMNDPIGAVATLSPIETLVFWLGPVNFTIGVFNLLPAFPLDGGRVFRAILWKLTGDLHRATDIAASVGRAIGLAFMLAGIGMAVGLRVPFFGTGMGGLWLALIGWFIRSAATRSFAALAAKEVLDGVRVAKLMHREGAVLEPDATVRSAVEGAFMRGSEHAFPVVDGRRLLGLVCVGDIRRIAPEAWDTTPIGALMTPRASLAVVTPDMEVKDALEKLAERDVDQVPVLDGDDNLVGMLSRSDVARWFELHLHGPRRPLTPRAV